MQAIIQFWKSGRFGRVTLAASGMFLLVTVCCTILSIAGRLQPSQPNANQSESSSFSPDSRRASPTVVLTIQTTEPTIVSSSTPTQPSDIPESTILPDTTLIATIPVPSSSSPVTVILSTPTPTTDIAYAINGGNFRSEPIIIATNIKGQICPGDTVELLDHQETWYFVRVLTLSSDCVPQRIHVGEEGWVSSSLLSSSSTANVVQKLSYKGEFTNTTFDSNGRIELDMSIEKDNVYGYINFTNNPNEDILCGAGSFKGTRNGNKVRFSFSSNDRDNGCGFDSGWSFVIEGVLSENNRSITGSYIVNNEQGGTFQASIVPCNTLAL